MRSPRNGALLHHRRTAHPSATATADRSTHVVSDHAIVHLAPVRLGQVTVDVECRMPARVLHKQGRNVSHVTEDDQLIAARTHSAPGISLHRQFIFEEHVSAWSGAFVDALAAEDRSILILAGYWLEHQILATALHALAESYDVCVLLDATPPRYPHASRPARDRLNQAGATPVVASQVIHEWTIETSDAAKRSALDSLSSALMLGG